MSSVIGENHFQRQDVHAAAFEEVDDCGEVGVVVPAKTRPLKAEELGAQTVAFSHLNEEQLDNRPMPASPETLQGEFREQPVEPEQPAEQVEEQPAAQSSTMEISAILDSLAVERQESEAKIQEAYERGLADGERIANENQSRVADQYAYGLERIKMLGHSLETLARHEALEIALLIAKRIIQREIEISPMILVEEIKRAATNTIGRKELTIKLHPADLAVVREMAPDLADHFPAVAMVNMIEDEELERGDCIVDTEVEQINLSLSEQLSALKKSLQEEVS